MAASGDVLSDKEVRALLYRPTPPGRPCKYPWQEWLDGQWRSLVCGVHFTCSVNTFRSVYYAQATRSGLQGECRLLTDGRLAIRALPKAEPQP